MCMKKNDSRDNTEEEGKLNAMALVLTLLLMIERSARKGLVGRGNRVEELSPTLMTRQKSSAVLCA
jgi:hypothetical protein